jgi:nicotinate-nucleotide pyrophosphorylase (carboxylating)
MLDPIALRQYAELALREDLFSGDITTDSVVPSHQRATVHIRAKQELVVCGGPLLEACFVALDPSCLVTIHVQDGTYVNSGTTLWSVAGNSRCILKAERSALNYVQRLSGISTLARRYAAALPPGSSTRIADTRKTTPGLRPLERYAVQVGGAYNHRDNLGSAVMIKDNHIVAGGGITTAVGLARARAPHTAKIEVEVESLAMLDEALDAGADIVMLDNFSPDDVAEAVRRCRGKALVEVSGGITLARISTLADAGVDIISVGALTHSAPSADISLDFEPLPRD